MKVDAEEIGIWKVSENGTMEYLIGENTLYLIDADRLTDPHYIEEFTAYPWMDEKQFLTQYNIAKANAGIELNQQL